jgi:hypothetical protein
MRAWLEILRERHPGISWMPAEQDRQETATGERATEGKHARVPAEAVTTAAV